MQRQKRVAAVHDISGFGKCSLTVALPVISAAGIETAVIPTAVLSTHTGGFEGYTYRDLTEDILPMARHWASLSLHFDAIYSGFLGSREQIQKVIELISLLDNGSTLKLIDPAMADNGKMYSLFDKDFALEMLSLCKSGDVIVPNFTEAAFMLGEDYLPPPYSEDYVRGLIFKLREKTGAAVVLTGVSFCEDKIGAACIEKNSDSLSLCLADTVDGMYHGTGDVFASVLTAALVKGFSLDRATKTAVEFTQKCILRTRCADRELRYGVDFERGLGELSSLLMTKDDI